MADTELTSAFVLHTRPFKETSLIVELFTEDHGRVNVLAKGVRGNRKNSNRALLQAFQPLKVSWLGRGELKTLKQLEPDGFAYRLQGIASLSALYLNELLLRLFIQWDPHPDIFHLYKTSLHHLQLEDKPNLILREFELELLDVMGYAIDWQHDIYGDAIEAGMTYGFVPEQGFIPRLQTSADSWLAEGAIILAVADHQWHINGAPALARKVCRLNIDQLLNGKELNSRKLLQQTLAMQS
ncbi:DNA repair protein RecO [Kangiella sp.]|uniref:DNA repair protein RecO n=1 Tax=Kangiella sp. TaxID=1920245 RepID=UPI0019C22873|nr:DNA repair protein RecO [Kangiella sp.]MBD3653572.1 DNA repair protein RecO [Kangiella sp.]